MAKKLEDILANFSRIQSIATPDVPTADDASGLKNVTRPDEARPEQYAVAGELMRRAPNTDAGHIRVPAVFS